MVSSPGFVGTAVLLGLLSAIGPFAIDMYLPALPDIGRALGADIASVQQTLTVFFVAIAIGQLLYGPLSDRFGRRPPLFVGLTLFALASVGCAVATDIRMLIALRFVQGLGAAAGMAIPRAVVRDLHTGVQAARLMSLLMLVFSVSPILAPIIGSGIIAVVGWRGIFWAVAAAAIGGLLLTALRLDETRPASQRTEAGPAAALAAYGRLLRDRHFIGVVLIGAFALTSFFVYLAASSFVLIDYYGLSPTAYSIVFGINAAAFFGAAQFNGRLAARFGLVSLIRAGMLAAGLLTVVMLGYFLAGGERLAVLVGLLFAISACVALVIPTCTVVALDAHGPIAGTASALMGTLQMICGAVAMGLVGLVNDGRPMPMVVGMATATALACLLTVGTFGIGPLQKTASAGR